MYLEDSREIKQGDRVILWEKSGEAIYATIATIYKVKSTSGDMVRCIKDSGGVSGASINNVRKISYMEEPSMACLRKYISKLLEII